MNFDDLLQSFNDLLNQFTENFMEFLPTIISVIAIVLAGFALAWIVKSILNRFTKRLVHLHENEKSKGRWKNLQLSRSLNLLSKAIYWLIVFIFVIVATELLGLPIITTWLSGLLKYFPNLLVSIIIITLGIIGGKLLRDLIATTTASQRLLNQNFLGLFVQYSIIALSILIAVDQIGIDISFLFGLIYITVAALLLGAGLAFGLGAKISVSNILASYYLQTIYKVGQPIKIEGIEGRIIQFKPTSVILETSEGQVTIPAKKFSEENSTLIKKD